MTDTAPSSPCRTMLQPPCQRPYSTTVCAPGRLAGAYPSAGSSMRASTLLWMSAPSGMARGAGPPQPPEAGSRDVEATRGIG